MSIKKEYWLKFLIPFIISFAILLTMILSIKSFDAEGNVDAYHLLGIIIILGLFIIQAILFFANLIIKYQRGINNFLPNIIFIIYCALTIVVIIKENFTMVISSITFYSVIYALSILINFIIYQLTKKSYDKQKNNYDKYIKGELPLGWFSKRDHLISQLLFIILVFLIPVIIYFEKKFIFIILLIIASLLEIFIYAFRQSYILRKILNKYFITLDFEELANSFARLQLENLHPRTANDLELIKIDLLLYHDFNLAEELLNNINTNDQNLNQNTYNMVLLDYYFIKGHYNEGLTLIDDLLREIKSKMQVKIFLNLRLLFQLMIKENVDSKILDIYRINTKFLFHNLQNSYIHSVYYYYHGEKEKARGYLENIINGNHHLLTLKAQATKLLNTINEDLE